MQNPKFKILVVDDVEENLKLVSMVLEQDGYEVETARDGLAALELAHVYKYNLILLDIMMPVMGGFETCRYLKVTPETASVPVIFFTANNDKESLRRAYSVGGIDYIKKPFFKEELLARVNTHVKLKDYEKNLENKVIEKTKEISDTQVKLIHTLGGVAEGHSKETHLHVKRVTEFTYLLAKLYGMDEKEALILKDASALHDIGKLSVSDNILHKEEKLTKAEFKSMKEHVVYGQEMLSHSQLPLFKIASIICMQHHERYDGTGYPKKLKGDEIHIYGRIVAIADVFDALIFKKAYKDEWTQNEVLSFIEEMKGKHFDPKLVDIIFDNLEDFLNIYNKQVKKYKKIDKKKMNYIVEWLFKER